MREFVDLSSFLSCDPTIKSDSVALTHEGQHLLVVDPQASKPINFNRRKKPIMVILLDSSLFNLCSRLGCSKLNYKRASHGSYGPYVFNGSAFKKSGGQPLAPI